MWCKKCGNYVYWDKMYDNPTFIDLVCLGCAKRWFVNKDRPLARWVVNQYGR